MSIGSRAQVKTVASPSFKPLVQTILQRKCACGNHTMSGECEECKNTRGVLQRRSANERSAGAAPPIVHEALHSPGQPLDATTRAFMEPRFGHDFSGVRVHTDAKAAESTRAVGALAYTVGEELVFGHDQYEPRSGTGRMLIAHELAHTIQQQTRTRDSATDDGALERDADNAVSAAILNRPVTLRSSAVAPAIQFLKISSGALGKALEVFTNLWNVPERAISLLRKSPSFMKLAVILDDNYVWRSDSFKEDPAAEPGPDGRLKKGRFKGKRELANVLRDKPSFKPFEAPPEPGKSLLAGDVIFIESLDVPGFISEIAHEATHAARFVGATTPPPASIVDEVKAQITEEIETARLPGAGGGQRHDRALPYRL